MNRPVPTLDELSQVHGVFLCVECGKCSAVCPMADLYDDYRYQISPRGIVEHALLGLPYEDEGDVWSCLTCDLCTNLCPQGVKIRDFVVALREKQLSEGIRDHAAFCAECGTYVGPTRVVHLVSDTSSTTPASCPRCRCSTT